MASCHNSSGDPFSSNGPLFMECLNFLGGSFQSLNIFLRFFFWIGKQLACNVILASSTTAVNCIQQSSSCGDIRCGTEKQRAGTAQAYNHKGRGGRRYNQAIYIPFWNWKNYLFKLMNDLVKSIVGIKPRDYYLNQKRRHLHVHLDLIASIQNYSVIMDHTMDYPIYN